MPRIERPDPAGFGNCPECPYRSTGTADFCFDCASMTMEDLAEDRCPYCELPVNDEGECGNPVCNWSDENRYFKWVWAISMRSGELLRAIDKYKVQGKEGWAWIFGRVLVGYLHAHAVFKTFDLIVPSPTFVGNGGRSFDHTARVIERASVEDDSWPFVTDVIVKTQATPRFRGKSWQQRYQIAEGELRDSLQVPRPGLVEGKDILVYDDVFTEGLTIREVARALKLAGATEVSQVVLARQPWRG